jgi:RimJ/RimL family protein N-acetyltransferase
MTSTRFYRDPEIRRYFPEGTLTLEETRDELAWFLNGHPDYPELGLWATIHKPTGQFIGRCGLLAVDHRRRGRGGDRLPDRQALAAPGPRRGGGTGAGAVRVRDARAEKADRADRSGTRGVDQDGTGRRT